MGSKPGKCRQSKSDQYHRRRFRNIRNWSGFVRESAYSNDIETWLSAKGTMHWAKRYHRNVVNGTAFGNSKITQINRHHYKLCRHGADNSRAGPIIVRFTDTGFHTA